MRKSPPLAQRFWAKVDKRGPDECWRWTAFCNPKGYGTIGVNGRAGGKSLATHIALEFDGRPRIGNAIALHSCDNPGCVNPKHLRWGTNAENVRDMVSRKRHASVTRPGYEARGERQGHAILTADKVREIRASTAPHKEIAAAFNVSVGCIYAIVNRNNWKHVE